MDYCAFAAASASSASRSRQSAQPNGKQEKCHQVFPFSNGQLDGALPISLVLSGSECLPQDGGSTRYLLLIRLFQQPQAVV